MSAREVGEVVTSECPRCGKDMEVIATGELPPGHQEVCELVGKNFKIHDFVALKNRIEFEVSTKDTKKSFSKLHKVLRQKSYLAALRKQKGELRLLAMKFQRPKPENVLINVLLFLMTLGTTFFVGYLMFGDIAYAVMFSCAIVLMLGSHELGHKIAAWRNGVDTTPPYFIPLPLGLGTLGAVIKIKSPIPTKEALVEMGASGPILGFLVALPLTFVGLAFSRPDPEAPLLITPLIFAMLQLLTLGQVSPGLVLNPLAFAGLVMIIITALNLMPAGQLDGGHVARGLLSREKHYKLTRVLGFSLVIAGLLLLFPFLWFWGFLILLFFGGYHMGALDDVSKLSQRQKHLAIAALVIFVLCIPLPLG
jgi:hypothetical protein